MNVAERVLPHNLEAEQAVLGSMLLSREAAIQAFADLQPKDFYRHAHQTIFRQMLELDEGHSAIDLITVKAAMARAGTLDESGGPAYLMSLADGLPRGVNIAHYARIVRDFAGLRELITVSNRIQAQAYDGDVNPDQILEDAESAVFRLRERKALDVATIRQFAERAIGDVEIDETTGGAKPPIGIPSGFTDLDELTGGWQPTDLILIAARPSMGKTSLAVSAAVHAAKAGISVAFFSLEMSSAQLFLRIVVSESHVEKERLRTRLLGMDDWDQVTRAFERLHALPLYIDESGTISTAEIRAKARRLRAEYGIELIVVDYLQLISANRETRDQNRTQQVGAISRDLKAIAKELSVPVIALSQLSRAPEARHDKRPGLSDLRESGALEQDADVVILIFRDDRRRRPRAQIPAELIIAKQRNNPTGIVRLAWLPAIAVFDNLARQDDE